MKYVNAIKKTVLGLLITGLSGPAMAQQWDTPKADECLDDNNRQYSAVLRNIPVGVDWEKACKATPMSIRNHPNLTAEKCIEKVFTGMWGEFKVPDSSCSPGGSKDVHIWELPKKDHCSDVHTRQYSAIVKAKSGSKSFKETCKASSILISGTPYKARTCSQKVGRWWGEFDVLDTSCLPDTGKVFDKNAPKAWLVDSTRNWMGKMPENTKISELSIPGSHDSASYNYGGPAVRTQAWTIRQQLDAGIRYLDIRHKTENSKFLMMHGPTYLRLDFDTVLDDIKAFLKEQPNEVVIMGMMEQGGEGKSAKTTEEVWQAYFDSNPDLFYEGQNKNVTLADAKGKIVLFCIDACPNIEKFDHIRPNSVINFVKSDDAAIVGHNKASFSNVTPEDCMKKCRQQRDNVWWCRSFDYNTEKNSCDLSDKQVNTTSYAVAEKDRARLKENYTPYDHYSVRSEGIWAKKQNKYKVGNHGFVNPGMITVNKKDQEIQKAMDEATIEGWVSNYWSGSWGVTPGLLSNIVIPTATAKILRLTENGTKKRKLGINIMDFPDEEAVYQIVNSNFDHVLAVTKPADVDDFKKTANAAISGHNTKKLTNVSVDQCKKSCANSSEDDGWFCKSFDYHKANKSCDLSDKNEADVGLKKTYPGNPYDYYENTKR